MNVRQYDRADTKMVMKTRLMERYSCVRDSVQQSKELYKEGFELYIYNTDGLMESQIISEEAMHTTGGNNKEQWVAYGGVNILNHIKGERIITDTVYYDIKEDLVYTNCYVVITSPQGKLQGYGLRSDDRIHQSIIMQPFDSYGVVVSDSTKFYIDTVNFVGPPLPRYLSKK